MTFYRFTGACVVALSLSAGTAWAQDDGQAEAENKEKTVMPPVILQRTPVGASLRLFQLSVGRCIADKCNIRIATTVQGAAVGVVANLFEVNRSPVVREDPANNKYTLGDPAQPESLVRFMLTEIPLEPKQNGLLLTITPSGPKPKKIHVIIASAPSGAKEVFRQQEQEGAWANSLEVVGPGVLRAKQVFTTKANSESDRFAMQQLTWNPAKKLFDIEPVPAKKAVVSKRAYPVLEARRVKSSSSECLTDFLLLDQASLDGVAPATVKLVGFAEDDKAFGVMNRRLQQCFPPEAFETVEVKLKTAG
ncbi:MAG: hypothetical protein K1X64_06375 [Myxococcaceae bacterium]|nr:hypothetical protein [Myxococcaceae bacterium]